MVATRVRMFQSLILFFILVAVFALSSTIAQTEPQQGGEATIALPAQPETLNPVLIGELSSSIVNGALFASLTAQNPETFDIEPYLAERWEAADDLLSWTFYLRQDALWHDGTPITADDVKFTFDRILDPEESAQGLADVSHVSSVEVIDDHTVRFVLSQVDGQFPDRLALGSLQPLPKHIFENFDKLTDAVEINTQQPVGSGPFKFKSATTGSYIELEAFDEFFLGRPYLDRLLFSIVPDLNVRVARLRAGDIDWTDIEPVHVAALENDSNIEVIPVASSRYPLADFAFEGPYAELFEDPRVRIAMTHAVDQQAILDTVALGRGQLLDGLYIPDIFTWLPRPEITPYDYDPERAQALLAEAGWSDSDGDGIIDKDGKPFKFYILVDRGNVQREQIGLILQEAWQALGMDVDYVAGERTGQWIEETRARTFPVRLAEFPVPNVDWFRRIYHSEGPNTRGYSNPEVDALIDQAIATSDREEQGRLYQQAQELMHQDPPVIPFFLRDQLVAVRTRLGGVPQGELKLATPYAHLVFIEQ